MNTISTENPQDKINEFFHELDKMFPPNHPFIVKWGPADTFKNWIDEWILEEFIYTNQENDEMRNAIEEAVGTLIRIEDTCDTNVEKVRRNLQRHI